MKKLVTDEWAAFSTDYSTVIHAETERNTEKLANCLDAMSRAFNPVSHHVKLIEFLLDDLDLWAANTKEFEQFKHIYEVLKIEGNKKRTAALKNTPVEEYR